MENQQGDCESPADQAAPAPESLLESVNGGSQLVRTLFITYVATLAYVGLVVSATTHEMILRDSPVELPILGVALSLEGFYRWTPILLLILHANLLLQAYLLAEKIRKLRASMDASGLRLCLHQFPFSHWLMLWETRSWLHFTLSAVVWLFLVAAPLGLLYLMAEQYWVLQEGRGWWVTLAFLELLIILLFASLLKRTHQPHKRAAGTRWDQVWEFLRWLWGDIWSMVRRLNEAPWQTLRQSGYQLFRSGYQLFWILLPLLGGFIFIVYEGMKEASLQLAEAVLVDGKLPAEVQFQVRQHRSGIGPAPEQGREEVPGWLKKVKGLELRGKNLKGADFTGAWLINADFRKARGCVETDSEKANECMTDLEGANFKNALLVGTLFDNLSGIVLDNFEGADLRWASFRNVKFCKLADGMKCDKNKQKQNACNQVNYNSKENRPFYKGKMAKGESYRVNLAGADLTNAELSNMNLSNISFRRANFSKADLNSADLNCADLTDADLTNTNLTRANLTGAQLTGANLIGAALDGVTLDHANMWEVTQNIVKELRKVKSMIGIRLGPNLRGLNMENWKLGEASLSRVDLSEAVLIGAVLSGADLAGANLTKAKLEGANLTKAKLKGANLAGTNLDGADLAGADLAGATLINATLNNVTLDNADLRHAILWREENGERRIAVDLSQVKSMKKAQLGPNLKELNMQNWRLEEVDLTEVDLTGSDLTGVNLTGAVLKRAILKNAKLKGTKLDNADLDYSELEGVVLVEASLQNVLGKIALKSGRLQHSLIALHQESEMSLVGMELEGATFSRSKDATIKIEVAKDGSGNEVNKLRFVDLQATLHLTNLSINKAQFIDGALGSDSRFKDVIFKENVLCETNMSKVEMEKVRFSKSLLYKVVVPSCDLFHTDENASNYLERIEDTEGTPCKGAKSMEWKAYLLSIGSEFYKSAAEVCSKMKEWPLKFDEMETEGGYEVSIVPPKQAGGLLMGDCP